MNSTKMILVGGFLGTGKTTLLAQASKILASKGKRIGLITNDQTEDLVDTELLRRVGTTVDEITGGCFCCRFNDLITSATKLITEHQPDVLIGEPVGSCTDLSATVLQPIKEYHASHFNLAPFSVLVDPKRLSEALDSTLQSSLHPSAKYILRKQLDEADVIVINKIDSLTSAEQSELASRAQAEFPDTVIYLISALSGEGVGKWLNDIMNASFSGRRIVPIDYDIYAEGEAVLGWLNAKVKITSTASADWQAYCKSLLVNLREKCVHDGAEIVHLKLILADADGNYITGNLTSSKAEPFVRGNLNDAKNELNLTINARVETSPVALESFVREALSGSTQNRLDAQVLELSSLSPGRPQPTYRFTEVV